MSVGARVRVRVLAGTREGTQGLARTTKSRQAGRPRSIAKSHRNSRELVNSQGIPTDDMGSQGNS